MPKYPEYRSFERGSDSDSSLAGVLGGFSRWMVNCLIQDQRLVNIKGNLQMSFEDDFTFFDDNQLWDYSCLGTYYDAVKGKAYWFVAAEYLSQSASFIFEYDIESGINYVVCDEDWSDALDFNKNELITSIFVVHIDEFRPLLYWSQEAGLRKINIYKAKQTFAQTGGYSNLVLETIDRIKYPPDFAPTIRQITDTAFRGNNIQKRFFQFSYRNVYDDYEISAPSDWSRVNIPYVPYGSVSNDIPLFEESQRNNLIWVTLKKPFSTVAYLEILVREKTSNVGTEINFDWIIYDRLLVADITWDDNDEYIYKFYNDKVGRLILQPEANKIFDNVPRVAKADINGEDGRNYDGHVTEGFDLEAIDVDVDFVESDFIDTANVGSVAMYDYINTAPSVDRGVAVLPLDPTELQAGGTIQFQFTSTDVIPGNYNFQYVIKEADLNPLSYPESLILAIASSFVTMSPTVITDNFTFVYGGTLDDYTFYVENAYPPSGTDENQIISAFYLPNLQNCLEQFKNNHTHYFAIGYSDEGGRRSSVQKLDKYYHTADPETVLKGRFSINHVPPIWATQYEIYYGGFDAGNFYQIKLLNLGSADADGNYTITINWLQTTYKYKDVTYLAYEYSAGDRIKFLYGDADGVLSLAYDFAILGVGANTTSQVIVEGSDLIEQLTNNSNFLIEIYKKSTQTSLYYTIDKNDIGNAGLSTRYHKGNIQDQDFLPSANPAIQQFNGVNTYIRPRFYTFIFSSNEYDFYNILGWIYGRVFVDGYSLFNIIVHCYSDSGRTDELVRCTFNVALSTVSWANDMQLVVSGMNNSSNWVSTNVNFQDSFFVDNYTANFIDNISKLYFTQNTDYPRVYWNVSASVDGPPMSDNEDDTFTTVPPSSAIETFYMEDPNQSDIFVGQGDGSNGSAVTSFGKPNIENPNFREVVRKATIWYSDKLIPESNINGLSSYPDGQFKDYSLNFGSIQRFVFTDEALKVAFELRWGWIRINQQVSVDSEGNTFILNTSTVLTQMNYYKEKRGVGTHPESVAEFAGIIYGLDPLSGCIYRISRDGMTIISDIKNEAGNYLVKKRIFDLINGTSGNFPATYNPARDTYEVCIGGISRNSTVLVWNETRNCWMGERAYVGEIFGTVGNQMILFYNGRLWLSEAGETYNNFFGQQSASEIEAVGNLNPADNKVYKNLQQKSKTAWAATIRNNKGQLSMIPSNAFQTREGNHYAQIRQDMNTPNIQFPLFNGNAIRDNVILVKLVNNSLEEEWIEFLGINQVISN